MCDAQVHVVVLALLVCEVCYFWLWLNVVCQQVRGRERGRDRTVGGGIEGAWEGRSDKREGSEGREASRAPCRPLAAYRSAQICGQLGIRVLVITEEQKRKQREKEARAAEEAAAKEAGGPQGGLEAGARGALVATPDGPVPAKDAPPATAARNDASSAKVVPSRF